MLSFHTIPALASLSKHHRRRPVVLTSQGYTTASGQTRKFPAILGEFGSFMNNSQDSCFSNGCIAGEGAVRGRSPARWLLWPF